MANENEGPTRRPKSRDFWRSWLAMVIVCSCVLFVSFVLNKAITPFGDALVRRADGYHETITGTITDTKCGGAHTDLHTVTEAQCVRDCVRNDSSVRYALDDGRHVYPLSDREIPAKFAARKVQVTGVFHKNTGLLDIETITPLN